MALQARKISGLSIYGPQGRWKKDLGTRRYTQYKKKNQHAEGIVTIMSDKVAKALSEWLPQGGKT